MTKTFCPYGCGKKFITKEHADKHSEDCYDPEAVTHVKRKGWCTPYGFGDFTDPITYEEACKQMQEMSRELFGKAANNE